MEKKRKIEILKDWIYAIDNNTKPTLFDNITNLENQLLFMYTNDEELNNKALVKALLYRMACRDGRYLEKYITLLEKEYNLSGRDLLLYKKFCYAYYILKKEAPDGRIYSEELRKEYIKKFNDIKLEISFLMEFVPEKIAVGPKNIVYSGYENSWKKKAVKNADKADKLERKYEYRKALELHLKNFEKFGYIYSCMKLGKLYDYYKEYDNALKYLKIAIENGRDDAVYTYESIISKTAYKKYLDLADKASTTEEEVENMFKAFKYNKDMELALKIARIYLEEGQAYTNIELGKKLLDYYWRFINGNNLEAHFGNFASINFDLYYNGSIYNKNIELACIAYKCLQFMDVEKSRIVSTEIANVCNTIHELISNDIIALGGESIEKQIEKLQVLSKEERIKQYIAAIETDKYDFDYWGRPGESSENLQKRQKYFKDACESKDLEDTIDKLRKSAKLGQAKAMLALYFYSLCL